MKFKLKKNNQDIFVQSLEGVGDILVFETRRRKNKLVLEGLGKIETLVKKYFDIREKDPAKFESFVFSQEFLEIYKKDEKEARFRLAFDPDKYLISFSTAINQIIRIYDAAVESENEEISNFSVYHLNWILSALSCAPGNGMFIEQILTKLTNITRDAVSTKNRAIYASSFNWYVDIVFRDIGIRSRDFDISYLELFDKYLYSTIKYIISEDQNKVFKEFIASIIDINIPLYNAGKIWEYSHLILNKNLSDYEAINNKYNIEKTIKELDNSKNDLDTKEKLQDWMNKLEKLKNILEQFFDGEQKLKARKAEEEIKEFAIAQYKYNNLLEIVFAIGAYCLFKQRAEYIKYLWDYKQPSDSDASWIGHDITPNSISGIIGFYFKKGLFDRRFNFWEGHHGSEIWCKKYFILLLAKALQNIRQINNDIGNQVVNFNIPEMHIFRLSDIEYSTDGLIELARGIKKETTLLQALEFDTNNIDELFDNKIIVVLQTLKNKAHDRIEAKHKSQNISPNKVSQFKKEVLKGFYESATIRDIFIKYMKSYEVNNGKKEDGNRNRFGMRRVDDKAAFFDEWHVNFIGWGTNYGQGLAHGENNNIFTELVRNCKEIKKSQFETIIDSFGNVNDIVIFSTNIALYRYFMNSKRYKPKWYKEFQKLDVKGFEGWYEWKDSLIPIFEIFHKDIEKHILILDKTNIGRFIQYSPLNEGEDQNLTKDIFFINVQAFSENAGITDNLIRESPEWLKKIGDETKQREYLQERVLIDIFERFEYNKPDQFKGYKLIIKEDSEK